MGTSGPGVVTIVVSMETVSPLTDTPAQNTPARIGTNSNWLNITAGGGHTLARKNGNGQLGNSTDNHSSIPIRIGTDTDWANIAAMSIPVASKTDGSLLAWGWGGEAGTALIGDGTVGERCLAPVRIH